jgi:spore coat polysaccharide biosynthesis predicted glycosyltransferase SpsG
MTQEDINAATTDIVVGTQYVPFTQEFQYLGSQMTTDLKDVTNINNRLLTHGQSDSSSLPSPWLNTALYGAESWTLNVELH